ncbi:MAG: alanine/glycine:cation symporter family protein [Pseudomonadota bacterium]
MANGIDSALDALMRPLADAVASFIFYAVPIAGAQVPLIVLWLIVGGLFFTIYLGGINLRGFTHALAVVRGRYTPADAPGEVSQFRALSAAVSGTVGVGNIAGVAVAISVGGPGATFWMIVAGLLGMSTKFAECTLAVKYREFSADGQVSGGPMYYLRRGLAERGRVGLGRGLAMFYALSMVVGCLGIGNMFQSNQAAAVIIDTSGGAASPLAGSAWLIGAALALAVGVVIVGGIRAIGAVTARLVPFMALLYVVCALAVLIANASALPGAFAAIFQGAFAPEGIAGGALGAMIIGFRRAVFSNEAGLGSASIAHSASRVAYPASEGYVGLLEPFIDTVVICTMTALVIITTVYDPALAGAGVDGIELTARAFASFAGWLPLPLALCAVLFAFSTMLAWSYYGLKAFTYLVGERPALVLGFKLFFLACVVLGATVDLGAIVDLSDALVFVVAIPNLLGLYLLAPLVRAEIERYRGDVLSREA